MGVAAEVYVCRKMADETGGTYGIALSEAHLEELMLAHAPPPAATAASAGAELVGGIQSVPELSWWVGSDQCWS